MVPPVVGGTSTVVDVEVSVMSVVGEGVGARGYLIMMLWNMLDGVGGERHAG